MYFYFSFEFIIQIGVHYIYIYNLQKANQLPTKQQYILTNHYTKLNNKIISNQPCMLGKHTISCFDGTLNGWYKQSPQKTHNRQLSMLQKLQQNLLNYQDQNNRMHKLKQESQQLRLPVLGNIKNNMNLNLHILHTSTNLSQLRTNTQNNISNLQILKNQHITLKLQNQLHNKKVLPLRTKTLMIYEKEIKQNQDIDKYRNKKTKQNRDKDKDKDRDRQNRYRKKDIVSIERIKEIGGGFMEFSDNKFFKDTSNLQVKSKSVKLHLPAM